MDGLECTEKYGKLCGKDSGLTDNQINIVFNVKKNKDCGECGKCKDKICVEKKLDLLIIGGISVNRQSPYQPQKDIIRLDMQSLKSTPVSSKTHPISGMQEFQRHCALNFDGKVIIIGTIHSTNW